MKRKIFFTIIFFFLISAFSSAGKDNGKCCGYSVCSSTNKAIKSSDNKKGFDLSPLRLFVFDI